MLLSMNGLYGKMLRKFDVKNLQTQCVQSLLSNEDIAARAFTQSSLCLALILRSGEFDQLAEWLTERLAHIGCTYQFWQRGQGMKFKTFRHFAELALMGRDAEYVGKMLADCPCMFKMLHEKDECQRLLSWLFRHDIILDRDLADLSDYCTFKEYSNRIDRCDVIKNMLESPKHWREYQRPVSKRMRY